MAESKSADSAMVVSGNSEFPRSVLPLATLGNFDCSEYGGTDAANIARRSGSRGGEKSAASRCSSTKLPRWKKVEHSVYFGRERLGRYVQTDVKKFQAFDANDRLLGGYRDRAKALAAIRRTARRARP
jgi:hypothetical protein